MRKLEIFLFMMMFSLTSCNWTQLNDWKQAYDEKKFEEEMTAKAKDFIKWYYDSAKADNDNNDDFNIEDFDLNFVRLGVENKNYVVLSGTEYDEAGEVVEHSYAAFDLSQWNSSIPFTNGAPPENLTVFGNLTRTEDGMGFICGEDCNSFGPNAELHKGLIFEEATPTSKDLEKMAALKEALKLNRASKAISSFYGLSEERALQLSKTVFSWKL